MHLKFISLNTHGASGNMKYISDILVMSDLLFISETWLLEDQQIHFKLLSKSHYFFGKSDMLFKPRFGRGFKGRFIFIHKTFKVLSHYFLDDKICLINFSIEIYIHWCLPYDNNTALSFY